MWWLIGLLAVIVLYIVNESYYFMKEGINIFGGVNYDAAVFSYRFFGLGIIRWMYANWDTPPTGWTKVWWRIYRKAK
jgi:hypothetical protein